MPQVTEDRLLAAIETQLTSGSDPALRVVSGSAGLDALESGDVVVVPTVLEFSPAAQTRRHWDLGLTVMIVSRLADRGSGTTAYSELVRSARAAIARVQGDAALAAYRAAGGHNLRRTRVRFAIRPGRESGLQAAAVFGLIVSFTE